MQLEAVLLVSGLLDAVGGYAGDDRACLWLTALSGRLLHAFGGRRRSTIQLFAAFTDWLDDAAMAERLAEEARQMAAAIAFLESPPGSPPFELARHRLYMIGPDGDSWDI